MREENARGGRERVLHVAHAQHERTPRSTSGRASDAQHERPARRTSESQSADRREEEKEAESLRRTTIRGVRAARVAHGSAADARPIEENARAARGSLVLKEEGTRRGIGKEREKPDGVRELCATCSQGARMGE